jgi:hypothetical protein
MRCCRPIHTDSLQKDATMMPRTWPLPPRPSTRAFIAEARRTPGYSFFDWLHGYVYGAALELDELMRAARVA